MQFCSFHIIKNASVPEGGRSYYSYDCGLCNGAAKSGLMLTWRGEVTMKSYLTHLECTYCGSTLSADELHRICPDCGKVLYPRYDLPAAGKKLDREMLPGRPANMWRYFEFMPIRNPGNIVSLGEGMTPLLEAKNLGEQ